MDGRRGIRKNLFASVRLTKDLTGRFTFCIYGCVDPKFIYEIRCRALAFPLLLSGRK